MQSVVVQNVFPTTGFSHALLQLTLNRWTVAQVLRHGLDPFYAVYSDPAGVENGIDGWQDTFSKYCMLVDLRF